MSSLILTQDLRIMMLEFAVENLYVPWSTVFDEAIMKRTTVMFRFLDEDWTHLLPHRRDYHTYNGSNYENEQFYGGRSVVFAIPEKILRKPMHTIDIQVYVLKEICKYFHMDSCQNIGFTMVRVDNLLNGIIKELQERKMLDSYLCEFHKNDPISRSMTMTYPILNEDLENSAATISLYIRITYLGECVVTEFERTQIISEPFYAGKDIVEADLLLLRELQTKELEGSYLPTKPYISPALRAALTCYCKYDTTHKTLGQKKIRKIKKKKARDSDIPENVAELYMERLRALMEALKKRKKCQSAVIGIVDKRKICPTEVPPCRLPCFTPCYPFYYQYCQPLPACCIIRPC